MVQPPQIHLLTQEWYSWSEKATSRPLDPKSFYISGEGPILPPLKVPGIGVGNMGTLGEGRDGTVPSGAS